ncbi:TylF/MycF/NovP-related O-methyltransferase [Rhizobium sp. LEGMi135b]
MSYNVSQTPTVFVDHGALANMISKITAPGARVALVGFGEYSKHLINLHPNHIVAVHDPRDWLWGAQFRDVPVLSEQEKASDINLIVVCEYNLVYEYLGKIVGLYQGVKHYIPPTIDCKRTEEIDVFGQEKIYQDLFSSIEEVPVSMMAPEKIKFLMELLRYGLTVDGDVVEMGCWQGGSTWYMARLLLLLGEKRTLFAMDLFETHAMAPTATMCTDEIERRLKRQYENIEMVIGLVDAKSSTDRVPGNICFAHIDLGYVPGALEFVWSRLSPGAPLLLDNYGHIGAPTWAFDRWFEQRNARIIRFPWSEQGLVIKR